MATAWRPGDVDLEEIPISDVPALNNDPVLDPDGEHIYVSANDWHIYRASLAGGRARRISEDDLSGRMHFLHGVSPDGTQLAYIGLPRRRGIGGPRRTSFSCRPPEDRVFS
jgi:TolB protein